MQPKKKVIVHSRAYGTHERAARGTYTEIKLSDAFKKSTDLLILANKDARLLKKELDLFCGDLSQGLLWQRLLSEIRKSYKSCGKTDIKIFRDFNVLKEYPLERLLNLTSSVSVQGNKMEARISWPSPPNFKRKFPDGYIFESLLIMLDFETGNSTSSAITSDLLCLAGNERSWTFSFDLTPGLEHGLIFLKLRSTANKKVAGSNATAGIRCIWTGNTNNDLKAAT